MQHLLETKTGMYGTTELYFCPDNVGQRFTLVRRTADGWTNHSYSTLSEAVRAGEEFFEALRAKRRAEA
jgi:hypothetical protein